jgi:hypothetical protein
MTVIQRDTCCVLREPITQHESRITTREIQSTSIVKRDNMFNGESVIRDNDALD